MYCHTYMTSLNAPGFGISLVNQKQFQAKTGHDLLELIDAPKAAPLLSGYQNAVPVNKKALVDLVQRVSAMADDIPEIRELACEPVLASASAAEITDARVRLGPEPTRNDLGPRRLR